MKAFELYRKGKVKWIMLGRDVDKPDAIIDTNQYVCVADSRALLMDPGGIEVFSAMLAAVLRYVSIEQLTDLFASHQDPDIISSLGLWDKALPHAKLHAPWLWEGFLRHFGMDNIEFVPVPDKGGRIKLGNHQLDIVPAHYLHSSGNLHIYDPQAKILMSGDVGAALEPVDASIYVEDFSQHIPKMQYFHQRWMPSNKAKNDWIERVSQLEIDMMLPQHGRVFKGDDVKRFLDWFHQLEVGVACEEN